MRYTYSIFLLAALTTFLMVFAAMAIHGIVHRRIQWESDSRPIQLHVMPVRFVLQMSFLLMLLALCVIGGLKLLRELLP